MAEVPIEGRNGVVIQKRSTSGKAYRTYEVHQRERVGESTERIKPSDLVSEEYRRDPYPALEILREHYPFYRDWLGNRYWVTRYNDVTSIFTDDANFETRPKRFFYGLEGMGRDLRNELPVLEAEATGMDQHAEPIAAALAADLARSGRGDLVSGFTGRFALDLLVRVWGIPDAQQQQFQTLYWQAQRGATWSPKLQAAGQQALAQLVELVAPLLSERRQNPQADVLSAIASIDESSAEDAVATLLEGDHETLHGALTNLWFRLLSDADAMAAARSERRLMKLAYLETLRHSPPTLSAKRFARHEVERFGKLIPQGALVYCSAAAANRDPRVFRDPERFIVDRRDLCQREPRGQYRADGLATGVAFGMGKPSKFPAIPEDRPRSRYAITRDVAVAASMQLVEAMPNLRLVDGANPSLISLTVGEMYTCWKMPVTN